jgi:GDPmannose 4,6-dehydratase
MAYYGFRGEDCLEEGYVINNFGSFKLEEGKVVIKVDSRYYRPTEVDLLIGDPTKAKNILGWNPKYNLSTLIKEMVESDLNFFKNELIAQRNELS